MLIHLNAWSRLLILALTLLNSIFIMAQSFEQATNTPFVDLVNGAAAFADIDNDGDNDLLVTGDRSEWGLDQPENYIAKLYKNDGLGNFTEVMGTPFIGVDIAHLAFADVDGDNDQDVLIVGRDHSYYLNTSLYLNDGEGNFSVDPSTPFPNIYAGEVAFEDLDGDDDLDVIMSGSTNPIGEERITSLYINDGFGGFVENESTPFIGLFDSSLKLSDFDLDGDKDILLLGTSQASGPFTGAYLNDGSGNFTVAENIDFVAMSSGDINFSDIDNDGDEDLLLSGTTDGGLTPYTGLFRSDGTGNFIEEQNTSLVDLKWVSSKFCDFNNDGRDDLIMTGKSGNDSNIFSGENIETNLYTNVGNGIFMEVEDHNLPKIDFASLACADVNGDDLNDLFMIGSFGEPTGLAQLHINTTIISSINELSEENSLDFNIYPNPNGDGILNIDYSDNTSSNSRLSIVNSLGKIINSYVVNKNKVPSINISHLESGSYFITLESGSSITTKKLLVIR